MCSIILPWAKWLSFSGIFLATLAAVLLAWRGSDLYNWLRRYEVRSLFDALSKLAAKHEKLERATKVPTLLEGSEIVHARLDSKFAGGLIGFAPMRCVWLAIHDRLRRGLNMPSQSLEWPKSMIRPALVEKSREDVTEALEFSIANTMLSESRYFKFAVWTFLIGSGLQLLAAIPWC